MCTPLVLSCVGPNFLCRTPYLNGIRKPPCSATVSNNQNHQKGRSSSFFFLILRHSLSPPLFQIVTIYFKLAFRGAILVCGRFFVWHLQLSLLTKDARRKTGRGMAAHMQMTMQYPTARRLGANGNHAEQQAGQQDSFVLAAVPSRRGL
jgi:hypothetical protein